jgi:hypothetical protein
MNHGFRLPAHGAEVEHNGQAQVATGVTEWGAGALVINQGRSPTRTYL